MNRGAFLLCATAGDCAATASIRLITAPEPVLDMRDYKALVGTTPVCLINVPEDGIFLGPAEQEQSGTRLICEPGPHATMIAGLERRSTPHYVLTLTRDLSVVRPMAQEPVIEIF